MTDKLCVTDLCAVLNVSRWTLRNWVKAGLIPKPKRSGINSVHKVADVVAAVKKHNLAVDSFGFDCLCQPESMATT